MQQEHDGMLVVRAELCERLEALQAMARKYSAKQFAQNVDGLKRLAALYGFTPVVRIADALERAIAEDGGACPRSLYLRCLEDAIGCERREESAAEAMLASISVRLCA